MGAPPAAPAAETAPTERVGRGAHHLRPRHRRPLDRRRRAREAVLVLVVLLVALGATVFLLASQWMLSAPVTATVGAPA